MPPAESVTIRGIVKDGVSSSRYECDLGLVLLHHGMQIYSRSFGGFLSGVPPEADLGKSKVPLEKVLCVASAASAGEGASCPFVELGDSVGPF